MNEVLGCKAADPKTGYAATNPKQATVPDSIYKQLGCDDPTHQQYSNCQTWRQAEAAEEQVCMSRWQFWVGSLIGLIGLAGLFFTIRYTADSARAASDAVIAGQRAWVRRTRISTDGPLYFRPDGLITGGVRLEYRNEGNAPALNISAKAWLLPLVNGYVPIEEARKRFEEFRVSPTLESVMLYQGERYPGRGGPAVSYSIDLRKEDADAATDEYGRIRLFVAACIKYTFATDPDNFHHTCCLFEIEQSRLLPFVRTPGSSFRSNEVFINTRRSFGRLDFAT